MSGAMAASGSARWRDEPEDAMRLLVTGARGQLAHSLADLNGTEPGLEVIAAGRPKLDLLSSDSIESVIAEAKPECVVNAAAYTAVDKAEEEEDLAYAVNATGAGEVARLSRQAGVPIVHVSTDYVFAGTKQGAYVEEDAVGPISAYGRTKLAGEKRVMDENADHVILRTSWLFSRYGNNFVTTMLRLAKERDCLSVVDDQRGTPTHAGELAKACVAIARRLVGEPDSAALRGVFHYAAAEAMSWAVFAERIMAASRAAGGPAARIEPIPSSQYPTAAKRPKNSELDCTKGQRVYGFALARLDMVLPKIACEWRD